MTLKEWMTEFNHLKALGEQILRAVEKGAKRNAFRSAS
jgi:hypothetical protein